MRYSMGCLCVQSVVYCKAYERASIQTKVSMHLFTLCVHILLVFLWPEGGGDERGGEGGGRNERGGEGTKGEERYSRFRVCSPTAHCKLQSSLASQPLPSA